MLSVSYHRFSALASIQTRHSRRICPVTHVAGTELDLSIVTVLWAFESDHYPMNEISLDEYNGQSSRRPEL